MDIFRIFNKNKPYKIAKTIKCGFLPVGDGHEIYYELSGNKDGIPVIIIHGGPGGSISVSKRALFNPKKYFIIQYDQRSCGKSKFTGDPLQNNTTDYLLEDIEKLRNHLDIKKWVICGTSWGAALGLSYAVKNKEKVLGVVTGAVFLASKEELLEAYAPNGVAAKVYPDRYESFIESLTVEERKEPLFAYLKRIDVEKDRSKKENLIKKFVVWEISLVSLVSDLNGINKFINSEDFNCDQLLLEMYYFKHDFFMDSKKLLKDLSKLSNIPTYIVQGRYDLLCPAVTSHKVYKTIGGSKLAFSLDGHSIKSKYGIECFVKASNQILESLKKDNV